MIEGGEDLQDTGIGAEPRDEYGRHFDPFTGDYYIGDFPSGYEALNVRNPRPGCHYYHAINPEKDGGSNLLHMMNKYGGEVVKNDDPEMTGIGQGAMNNGTIRAFGDVVAVRMSQDKYDEVKRREFAERMQTLEGVVNQYKEADPGYMGKPTRFVRDSHGQQIEDF